VTVGIKPRTILRYRRRSAKRGNALTHKQSYFLRARLQWRSRSRRNCGRIKTRNGRRRGRRRMQRLDGRLGCDHKRLYFMAVCSTVKILDYERPLLWEERSLIPVKRVFVSNSYFSCYSYAMDASNSIVLSYPHSYPTLTSLKETINANSIDEPSYPLHIPTRH
jgi:hypothetical protein